MEIVPNLQLQIKIQLFYFLSLLAIIRSKGAVAPPAWANPKLNPCASQPRGWQLLYWPPDGKCYKIFQVGYPCPEEMELSPVPVSSTSGEQRIAAECRCPPETAQFAQDGQCYPLYTIGPCEKGQYFAPDVQYASISQSKRKWGICKQTQKCSNNNEIYWPKTNRCYLYLTNGPCPKGQLVTLGPDKIAICKCNHRYEMRKYWSTGNGCFEHFTRGPCREIGHLFLPDRSCGCHNLLPHYHNDTQSCYEIGTIGPCNTGEQFLFDPDLQRASCQCKKGHVRYEDNLNCYRPFTQGPCESNFILVNTTACIRQPCERGYLYFPENQTCYRIGTKGPCKQGQIVTFDFDTRPSIDGISYNGICHCRDNSGDCSSDNEQTKCNNNNGQHNVVSFNNQCYKLYSQGPCPTGAWLTIKRQSKAQSWNEGICECMPNYKENIRTTSNTTVIECVGPTVLIAEYLNKNFFLTEKINK